MSENKELLEATVKGLQDKIMELEVDLKSKEQELEDVNKPEITALQLDIVNDAVDSALGNYDLDCGHFDYEFELDYENRITLSNLTFTDTYDLVEAIVKNIENHFKVIDKNE